MNFTKLGRDIVTVSMSLFRVMIPTLIIVKIAEMMGAVGLITKILAPIAALIGLPPETALALTTTMLTNPYTGLMVLASTPLSAPLTILQTSLIASFMLFTHGLPVEAAISRQAGTTASAMIVIRIATAILFCLLINLGLGHSEFFDAPAHLNLPQFTPASGLLQWGIDQIKGLIFVQIVIIVLLTFLEFLRVIGVERLIRLIVSPFLDQIRIGAAASTIVVVGLTLGLGFGGGLMIKDVKSGQIPARSAVGALILINLFHSVFEDTTVMMLLGPSLIIILALRAVFVFALVYVILGVLDRLPVATFQRFMVNANAYGKS